MVYTSKQKEYFIYKEYDDEFGYKERIYISCVFENIDDLLKHMNERKRFYTGNTRKIEIELIHSKRKSDE